MFMWYTHNGVGHPVTLQRMIRDIVAPADAMNVIDEDASNSKDHESWDHEQEDGKDKSSDEELEDKDKGDYQNDRRGDKDKDKDVLDDLSFWVKHQISSFIYRSSIRFCKSFWYLCCCIVTFWTVMIINSKWCPD